MKKFLFILSVFSMVFLSGCVSSPSGTTGSQQQTTTASKAATTTTAQTTTKATTTANEKLTYGDMVEVGPFEYTLVKTEVKKIDNQFSDIKEAILLYVTIKNTGDETKDIMFIYNPVFGPDENEVETTMVGIYFDDSIDIMAKIRAGVTLEGYYVCEYVGDGEYIMEVYSLMEDPQEIYFDVMK